jgi:dihydroorotase
MQFLLKSVNVLDPRSTFYKKVVDIEFSNGKITQIDSHIEPKVDFKVIEGKELCIATGFIDLNAQSGEPHFSVAENMASLEKSAAKGGFTHVCHFPHENHFVENESDIYFLKSKNQGLVKVLPVGSITQKKNQKNMAELYDMYVSGAVAFTNGNEMGMVQCMEDTPKLFHRLCNTVTSLYPHNHLLLFKITSSGIASTTLTDP